MGTHTPPTHCSVFRQSLLLWHGGRHRPLWHRPLGHSASVWHSAVSRRQILEQPSPLERLPSSQCSPASTRPLPHWLTAPERELLLSHHGRLEEEPLPSRLLDELFPLRLLLEDNHHGRLEELEDRMEPDRLLEDLDEERLELDLLELTEDLLELEREEETDERLLDDREEETDDRLLDEREEDTDDLLELERLEEDREEVVPS